MAWSFVLSCLTLTGYFVASAVAFYGMALVAHRFVPALCALSERLKIPTDVAGATLMAAGASSPELFSNVISVYITKSDIGVGTIIGSEMFNMMMILSAVVSSRPGPQQVDPLISVRDTGSYLLALGLLLFAVSDVQRRGSDDDDQTHAVVVVRGATTAPMVFGYGIYVFLCSETGRLALTRLFGPWLLPVIEQPQIATTMIVPASKEIEETAPLLSAPPSDTENNLDYSSLTGICLAALWPVTTAIQATIPSSMPCLAAFSSIVWMSALSYGMVLALERFAAHCGVSTAVIGITLSAVGTSWPNLVSSMAAARRGEANMAISNAFGSNIFNICIALGLPWLFYPALHGGHDYTRMHDDAIDLLIFLLIAVLLAYVLLLVLTRYTLYPHFAFYFSGIYLAFLIIAIFARRSVNAVENREQGGH